MLRLLSIEINFGFEWVASSIYNKEYKGWFFLHFIYINFWTLSNKYTALVKIANKCYDYYKTATQRLQLNAIKHVTWDSFGSKNCSF